MTSKIRSRFVHFMEESIEPPLCGLDSPLGDFAEWMTFWTEKEYPDGLPPGTRLKCWCCAFWRGVTVGMSIGLLLTLAL